MKKNIKIFSNKNNVYWIGISVLFFLFGIVLFIAVNYGTYNQSVLPLIAVISLLIFATYILLYTVDIIAAIKKRNLKKLQTMKNV